MRVLARKTWKPMDNPRKTSLKLSLISLVLVLPLHSPRLQAQNSLTNGLVAYWNFDNQDFNDSIGKFDGTGHGEAPISFIPGKPGFGQAIQLNGVDQFVEITGRDSTYKANDLAMAGGAFPSPVGLRSILSTNPGRRWLPKAALQLAHSTIRRQPGLVVLQAAIPRGQMTARMSMMATGITSPPFPTPRP